MTTFEEFAASRLGALLRVAVAICGDLSLAEDLVQDVLIKARTNWQRIDASSNPEAYVRRMLINEHLSWRRKWSRLIPTREVFVADRCADPIAQLADRDQLRVLIGRLPRQQQVVLALRYYGGFTDDEIADAMACQPGTVRGYASRALAAIRADLNAETETEEASP